MSLTPLAYIAFGGTVAAFIAAHVLGRIVRRRADCYVQERKTDAALTDLVEAVKEGSGTAPEREIKPADTSVANPAPNPAMETALDRALTAAIENSLGKAGQLHRVTLRRLVMYRIHQAKKTAEQVTRQLGLNEQQHEAVYHTLEKKEQTDVQRLADKLRYPAPGVPLVLNEKERQMLGKVLDMTTEELQENAK